MRDFEASGRSTVIAAHGMAATSHPLATATAIDVLKAGGTAMDAAVAACAVQCVVEPGSTGIGGDCFALYAPRGSGDVLAFNGAGRAPAAVTPDRLTALGVATLERSSPHSITVPGAVEAWARLVADHGRMPLGDLLAPAIALARDGYAISPRVHYDWTAQEALLRADANAARHLLVDGKAPALGSLHRQPALADTLSAIAAEGPRAFYEGPIAADMVGYLRDLGGLHTAGDFAGTRGDYVRPIRTRFRDVEVVECPPSGQGVVALLILNILARLPVPADPLSPERLHLEVEATRLAYAVRDRHLADGDGVPVDWMLSDALADRLAARIDPARALTDIAPPAPGGAAHRDTVYIAVVDKDRNAASFINSLFYIFGSGRVSPKSGVTFHNRGQSFVLDPAHPNAIGPGKRPLHTIIPGMLVRDGRAAMAFGVMGGHYQAMGHAHFVSKLVDYGLDPQAAIDLPRLFPRDESGMLEVERPLRERAGAALAALGHAVAPPATPIGGAQAVAIDWENGTLRGASDPRKDGCALGY